MASVLPSLLSLYLLLLCFCLFLSGYFPLPPPDQSGDPSPPLPPAWTRRVSPVLAPSPSSQSSLSRQVGRVVVVVIDALRADFVLEPGPGRSGGATYPRIPWLEKQLASGMATGWVARASPPTVTLPRCCSLHVYQVLTMLLIYLLLLSKLLFLNPFGSQPVLSADVI